MPAPSFLGRVTKQAPKEIALFNSLFCFISNTFIKFLTLLHPWKPTLHPVPQQFTDAEHVALDFYHIKTTLVAHFGSDNGTQRPDS